VIEGFKIDMTEEEILGHLEARIQGHRDRAARCDAKRLRLEGVHEAVEFTFVRVGLDVPVS
jgi:hypothetical protein